MSQNPFEAPSSKKENTPTEFAGYVHDGSGRGYVRQVQVIAILMIVQAVLLLLAAIFCAGYATIFVNLENMIPVQEQADFDAAIPEEQRMMMTGLFGVLAIITLLLAIMSITAAVMNLNLKGRKFGIATLLFGLASVLTCYCAPTGIGLGIYGLIIYFNPAVAEAFRMRASGMSKQEVLSQFVR